MRADEQARNSQGVWFGVFAICTLWLLVQNLLLAMWAISHPRLPAWAAAAALVRVAATLLTPLAAIACAALVGGAIAALPPDGARRLWAFGNGAERHGEQPGGQHARAR